MVRKRSDIRAGNNLRVTASPVFDKSRAPDGGAESRVFMQPWVAQEPPCCDHVHTRAIHPIPSTVTYDAELEVTIHSERSAAIDPSQ